MNPIEPSAALRTMAHMVREIYVSLLSEGFTEKQALELVGQIITAQMPGGSGSK